MPHYNSSLINEKSCKNKFSISNLYTMYSHAVGLYLVPISIALIISFLSIISYILYLSYIERWSLNEDFYQNIVHSKADELTDNLNRYDRSIRRTIRIINQFRHETIPDNYEKDLLFDSVSLGNAIDGMFVFDNTGKLVTQSGNAPGAQVDITSCPYFQFHSENKQDGFHISEFCLSSRPESIPSLAMSRRINHKDGSFAGIVAVKINLSYVSTKFKEIKLGKDAIIQLSRLNGDILIRVPAIASSEDLSLKILESPFFKRISQNKGGSFVEESIIDGVKRFYTYKYLDNAPLILIVAIDKADIVSDWYKRTSIIISVTLLLCISMIIIATFVKKEVLTREKMEAELAKLSVTDGLTGLYNRRHFDEKLELEWRQAQRISSPLTILMIDANSFKELNDNFGHLMGDRVLVKIGQAIKQCTRRAGDFAARYGGDEFVVILPNTNTSQAEAVANLIKKHLHILCEEFRSTFESKNFSFSISIGIASLIPSDKYIPKDLMALADKDLYRVKAEHYQLMQESGNGIRGKTT